MRVLQVTPQYPPQSGGVERHVAAVSERLTSRGHTVTVLTADAGTAGRRHERLDGVSVRRYRGFAPGDAFHVAPGLLRAVRRADVDVIHAHNYHTLVVPFAVAASGDRPVVVSTHYHGESASRFRDWLLRLYRPVGRYALRHADAVVAVSEWERAQLRADFEIDATVVPNGVSIDTDCEPLERDRPYLLCVGRLVEYKGVQYLVEALPALPEYDLLVAGSGPYRETLRETARRVGVDDRVSFLGYVPDERLPSVYAGAAAYVTLSAFEAYGMTVAEALAMGTPCVVRKAGALVDWTTREDCVGVELDEVVSGVRAAVGRDAPATPLPTWDDVVDELESVYEAMVD